MCSNGSKSKDNVALYGKPNRSTGGDMGTMKKLLEKPSVDLLVMLLTYIGIFPTTDKTTPRWLRLIRYLYPRVAFINMFYVMMVVHGADIYYSWGDVPAITEGTIHLFANLMAAVKTGAFLFQAAEVAKIVEALDRLHLRDHADNEVEVQIVKKTERISRRLVLFVPLVLTSLATFASTMQLIGGITTGKFLFKVHIPYDVTVPPLFELTLLHLTFSMVSSINIMGVTDTFIIVTMVQTLGRLKVLRYKMEHVHDYARKSLERKAGSDDKSHGAVTLHVLIGKDEHIPKMRVKYPNHFRFPYKFPAGKCPQFDSIRRIIECECFTNDGHRKCDQMSVKMNREMENALKECVKIHVEITKFVKRWEVVFSPVFAIQLACNLIPTGLLAVYLSLLVPFQLNEKEQALSQMLVGCILQLYVFCFLAKEITDEVPESKIYNKDSGDLLKLLSFSLFQVIVYTFEDCKIKDSIFKCKWLHASKKFKKSMQILISRANVPVVVNAFSFIPMSMQVFMTVSQNAYSYYVALLIYIKKHQVVQFEHSQVEDRRRIGGEVDKPLV